MVFCLWQEHERVKTLREDWWRAAFSVQGILLGFKLMFNKVPGPDAGTGYSNIVPAPEEYVEGLLYLITEEALSRLDDFEGVSGGHYTRGKVNVWNIEQQGWVTAETYMAVRTDDALKPPRTYLEEIIKASKLVGLSWEWVSRLEKFMVEAV